MSRVPSSPVATPQVVKYQGQKDRWDEASIKSSWVGRVDYLSKKIQANQGRYKKIEKSSGVPWYIVGCLHNMECSLSFRKHLHEGSSLSGRTRWVPKGRPVEGKPPFTFEESAIDALKYDRMSRYDYRDLSQALQAMEGWNGWGYKKYHSSVPTPYLWSGTSIYSKGKYVSDGKWSSSAVSKQVGCASILKHLKIYK